MKTKILVLTSLIGLVGALRAPTRPMAQERPQASERSGQIQESAANPVPLINQPLVPDAVAPGGPDFTLTVNGTGFVPGSVVNWNGGALATTFVSGSQLTAIVPAADIATAGTASVTVVNPGTGRGMSNVIFLPVTTSTPSATFGTTDYPTGSAPDSVATADLNGDGKLDLVVANFNSSTVSVYLGNGDGTFQNAMGYPTGSGPDSVVLRDFNGDGKIDLATRNFYANTVSVLLGNGDGTFQPHEDYATGSGPQRLLAADFNGDGKLDLAVTNSANNTVSILLGNGDGTFQAHVDYPTGTYPGGISAGDFNRDGKLDLAVANSQSNSVSVLLGNGDGTFQSQTQYGVGVNSGSVTTADFNNDGKLDLAVANDNSNSVSLLLGNGDGTFQPHVDYRTGAGPQSVVEADVNGDGKLDLAVASSSANAVSILLGNGDGTFQNHADYAVGSLPYSLAVGDFDGDGTLDLAVPNDGSNTVSVLLQLTGPLAVLFPTSLNFGTQLINTASAAQKVTLTNTGIATLNISSITASAHFLEANTCGSTVAAGASCTIYVKFKPSLPGTVTGTVTVTDNAPGSPQTVSLTGVGTAVSLSPTSVNFGNQPVGTTSGPQTVTLTNHAATPLSIFGVGTTGTDKGDFAQTNTCGSSVPAGSSCVFSVTFTPTTKGSRTATLNIRDNGGASPQTVALSGTGT